MDKNTETTAGSVGPRVRVKGRNEGMGKTGGNHGTTGNYIAVTIGTLSSVPHEELVSTVLDCRVIAQSAQTRTWRPIQSILKP